ncbi:MAG: glycosyltransferase family A protein [Bacteroidota bacterium]
MVDSRDDLGTAKRPFRVVACIPVYGRRPLLEHTIRRLYEKNGVYKVVCSGDQPEDKKLCESLGAVWAHHPNRPLGAKWNQAFYEAKEFNPDACLFVGSSDWLSNNWISQMEPYIKKYDLVGKPDCNFLHIESGYEVCWWPGYIGRREGESIGIGRLISKRVLDLIQWKPFDDHLNSSLDYSMIQKCTKVAANIHLVRNDYIQSLSISTSRWVNMHSIKDHISGALKSHFKDDPISWLCINFPEAFKIFNNESVPHK